MANLAKWGGGRSYVTRSDAEVPTLFAAETRRLLGDSVVEEPFRPRVKAWSPTLAGVDFAAGPELKGYVTAKPKRFSDVLLEAKQDLPLLAETHYGLGKTVGFLSDVKNRWAADWLALARLCQAMGAGRARQRAARQRRRRALAGGAPGREALIELTALGAGGSFRNALSPQVRVTPPGRSSSVVALRQTAPGRYRAQVPLGARRQHALALRAAAQRRHRCRRGCACRRPRAVLFLPGRGSPAACEPAAAAHVERADRRSARARTGRDLQTARRRRRAHDPLWPVLQRRSPCCCSCWTSWCGARPGARRPGARLSRGCGRERVRATSRALTLGAHRN